MKDVLCWQGKSRKCFKIAESGVDYDVVQAMDVNTSANAVYQHNFPHITICASSIAVSNFTFF